MKKAIAAAALVAVLLVLTTTRFGIFIVFDVLGDVGSDNLPTDPTKGPLVLSGLLSAQQRIPLPDSLEQGSGLHVDGRHTTSARIKRSCSRCRTPVSKLDRSAACWAAC